MALGWDDAALAVAQGAAGMSNNDTTQPGTRSDLEILSKNIGGTNYQGDIGMANALSQALGLDLFGGMRQNTINDIRKLLGPAMSNKPKSSISQLLSGQSPGSFPSDIQFTEDYLLNADPEALVKSGRSFGYKSDISKRRAGDQLRQDLNTLRMMQSGEGAGGGVISKLQMPTYQEGYGPQEWQSSMRQAEDASMQDYFDAMQSVGGLGTRGLGGSSMADAFTGQAGALAARDIAGQKNQMRLGSIETGRENYNRDVGNFNNQRDMYLQRLMELFQG